MNERNKDAYNRLRVQLKIDLLRLDDELVDLPILTIEAAEHAATAIAVRDDLKAVRDRVAAELDNEYRNTGDEEKKKPTEAQVKATILRDRRYIDVDQDFTDADLDASLWKALVDAFRTKGQSLRTACELIMAGYLSPESIVKRRKEELAEKREGKRPKVND